MLVALRERNVSDQFDYMLSKMTKYEETMEVADLCDHFQFTLAYNKGMCAAHGYIFDSSLQWAIYKQRRRRTCKH